MEKRFKKLLAENDEEEQTLKWENVFDETKEMTGHQKKYQHILDRTFLRPRDIIRFCNEVLSQYKTRMHINHGGQELFDNQDVNLAKSEYGHYFLDELDDELHKHLPNYRDYFELIKSIGVLQFSKEEFNSAYELKKSMLASGNTPSYILKELFEFSIVGFYRAGGKGYGGSEYVFKYKDIRAQFDESAQQFRLHPGLMDVLGLKKFSRS
jgi:hypothetical protein